jgi:hypothetical protein
VSAAIWMKTYNTSFCIVLLQKWFRGLFSVLQIWPSLHLLVIWLVRGLVINIRTLSLWFGLVSLPFAGLFRNVGMILF